MDMLECFTLFDNKLSECGKDIVKIENLLKALDINKYHIVRWLSREIAKEDWEWLNVLFTNKELERYINNISSFKLSIIDRDANRMLYLLHRQLQDDRMRSIVSHKCNNCS